MKKVNRFLVIAALFISVTNSYAQVPGKGLKPNPEKIIIFLDGDKDGKLSKIETANAPNKRLSGNFEILDANNDGFIEVSELKTVFGKRKLASNKKDEILKLADTNSDGNISIEEALSVVQKRAEKQLKMADTNNNGFLEPNELKKLKEKRAKQSSVYSN